MIIESRPEDYSNLIAGRAPEKLAHADSPIADPAVLQMLAEVAAGVRASFVPASWLIVEGGELVGMCSITRPPTDGTVDIGYGVAPTRRGRGAASRAIGEVLAWAVRDSRVAWVTAETAVDNIASQRVLRRNGFAQVGTRVDPEDGSLLCWRFDCRG